MGPTANWDYAIIRCNHYFLEDFLTSEHLQSVFCHEIGHAMGLSHELERTYVLMYQYNAARFNEYGVYKPTDYDVELVNEIYN